MKKGQTMNANKNFPIVIRQAIHSGLHKAKTYSQNTWVRLGFLGLLIFVLSQKDFSFSVSFGGQEATASLINTPPNQDIKAQAVSLNEESKQKDVKNSSTVSKTWWNDIRDKSKDIRKQKNLANAATAVGVALSEEEQKMAAKFSNLGFVLNPSYAEKHNIPQKVVEAKLNVCREYIKRFAKTAQEEADLFNIPASITLAQGLLESNAGDSRLSSKDNNHFGIKCRKKCLGCRCANYTDDSKYDMFRIFNSAWESYREHSKLLQGKRYKHLTKLDRTDYKNWAHGLKAAGYATDKKYADKLIGIIEFFELDKFDR
jgi:flagellum-specific peptidoglycan hydrolase FlgJ